MIDVDLFFVFRWLLVVVCTVYAVVQIGYTTWRWAGFFSSHPQGRRAGRYVLVQLLQLRVRRFAFDLLQIAAMVAILMCLVRLHDRL